MLSATPDKDRSLELIKLILSYVSQDQNVPDSVQRHFIQVVEQAKRLANDPRDVSEDLIPESIDLALEMKMANDFSSEINNVSDFNKITPALASRLLQSMKERHPI